MNENRVYCHFKGGLYCVVTSAVRESDGVPVVVYRELRGEERTFVRPLDEFLSRVECQGVLIPRFRYIGRLSDISGNTITVFRNEE
jgi:hypothetical protein